MPASGLGFILTRRLVRHQHEEKVELWLATDAGPVCIYSPPQKNVCFVLQQYSQQARELLQQHRLQVTVEPARFTTLTQQPVSMLRYSPDYLLTQAARQTLQQHGIELYEGDIKLTDRFIMERFAFGSVRYRAWPQPNGQLEQAQIKGSPYRPSLHSLSLDIECNEHEQLFSVGLSSPVLRHVLMVYDTPVATDPQTDFSLEIVADEGRLLHRLIELINEHDPDILLGWNVKQFDMAVLYRRAKYHRIPLALGRNGGLLNVRQWDNGTFVELPGRAIIDGIEALKTMAWHFDNYSLDGVASELLAKNKLVKEADQLAAIKHLYKHDPLQLAKYNFEDCELVNQIESYAQLIDFLILRSTLTGLDISRPGGSVAAFLNVYLPRLHRTGYVCGVRPADGGLASPGGYVMTSQPGLYDYVLVLDFKSLYPSIIRTFKIDPLGLVQGLQDPENAIPGFKNACFSRDQHFLPDIIANLWAQRDEAKRQHDKPRSQAIKILMNSFYGVLGSAGCPFYDPRLASSITLRGHEIMQTTAKWIEAEGLTVIYGDTDSTFVHLTGINSRDEAIKTGKLLEKTINQKWQQKLRDEYRLTCHLEIEFETCFDKFFMPTIRGSEQGSKKRYAGLVEANKPDSLVFKGLENVRSDWTRLAKDFQQTLYLKVFSNAPVTQYITEVVEGIRRGQFDAQLIYRKRLGKPLAQYIRNIPPHVRAAMRAEEKNSAAGNTPQFQRRTSVEYVMTHAGPQTLTYWDSPLDYEHYIEKQIRPIAESILPSIGLCFDSLIKPQLGLF
ncbi:DNA polymerase II [Salinimonas marina]|uniref:DNA polymerase n=1 Tax=Salinimonas marina TaxID=2785918 RepID=A0A7S9DY48_9ALTE|nr:DNA polymerase II [Salinimonas marina]QPG06116.1 DNA polymerase II [Salinimonas marina]